MPQSNGNDNDGQKAHQITWASTKAELNVRRNPSGGIDFDGARKQKLRSIEKYTHRPVIVYATDFLNSEKVAQSKGDVGVSLDDLQGFREILKNIKDSKEIDIIIHSPGGSADAADSIIGILRRNFTHIRFFIPIAAKSAATMMALASDEVWMPESAELGPIDPQIRAPDGAGGKVYVPAQTLVDQFDLAMEQIKANQSLAVAWAPILQIYGPGIYVESKNQIEKSKKLVERWLLDWMLKRKRNKTQIAKDIVDYLGNYNNFTSHGTKVCIDKLSELGVKVKNIRSEDAKLWSLVEEAWYMIEHTFLGTGAFKLYENSRGSTMVKMISPVKSN